MHDFSAHAVRADMRDHRHRCLETGTRCTTGAQTHDILVCGILARMREPPHGRHAARVQFGGSQHMSPAEHCKQDAHVNFNKGINEALAVCTWVVL